MNDAYDAQLATSEEVPSSGAAIASLVLSLIVCVPGLSLIATILGFVGISATSGGVRRGRGMAVAGVVVGLLVSVLWVGGGIVAYRLVDVFEDSIMFVVQGPTDTMKAAFADDYATVRQKFTADRTPSDEAIAAFAQALRGRYGAFKIAEPASDSGPPPGQSEFSMSYTFKFAEGSVDANVFFDIDEEAVEAGSGSFIAIQRIEIDGDGADRPGLELVGETSSPAATATDPNS